MHKKSQQCLRRLSNNYRSSRFYNEYRGPSVLLQKNLQYALLKDLKQIHSTFGCNNRSDFKNFGFNSILNNKSNFFGKDTATVYDGSDIKRRAENFSNKNVVQCSTGNYNCYPALGSELNLNEPNNECYPSVKQKKYPITVNLNCFQNLLHKPLDIRIGARECYPHPKEKECLPLEQLLGEEYPECPSPCPLPRSPKLRDLEKSPCACAPSDSPLKCPIPLRPNTLCLPPSPHPGPGPERPEIYFLPRTPLPYSIPLKPDVCLLPPSPLPCAPQKQPCMCPISSPPRQAGCPQCPPIFLDNPTLEPLPRCPKPCA